ncbi:hypothetical protein ACFYWX_31910 [Streptomyces sp. NPDC002888]
MYDTSVPPRDEPGSTVTIPMVFPVARSQRWAPATLGEVSEAEVAAFFAP